MVDADPVVKADRSYRKETLAFHAMLAFRGEII